MILILLIWAGAAQALPCQKDSVDASARHLWEKYKERPKWRGIDMAGHVAVLYQSTKGGWTLIIYTAEGGVCLLDAGESGETIEQDFDPGA